MRISISGSHRVGKTTMAEALAETLSGYELIPEPYHLLEEDGYEFSEMPSIEDFQAQLERSLQSVETSGPNVIFDRCAFDFLGYLLTHQDVGAFRPETWMSRLRESVAKLDLIVFVPIEEPDRIVVPRSESRLRAEVDAVLRDILFENSHRFEIEIMQVAGTPTARLQQVMMQLRRRCND